MQIEIMEESPETQSQLVSSHGMLAILEVLEARKHKDVTMKLLQIINLVGDDKSRRGCTDCDGLPNQKSACNI